MELPFRVRGDERLAPGEMLRIRERLRRLAPNHDLTTVIAYAFHRATRLLPFIYADTRIAPAGVRALGSALVDSGFPRTRIVLQQWNKRFQPSRMRLDGRIPDLFLVSSMQIHGEKAVELIADARRIEPPHRPLIIAGGPKAVYEPWDMFRATPDSLGGADVVVTGEEFVLLELLEVILTECVPGEPLREAFFRARDSGALDHVPGLVYPRLGPGDVAEELVDTGIQRLLSDFDELPSSVIGYRLLEPPSRRAELGAAPVPQKRIGRLSPIGSIVLTSGCKFRCPYCPIPAYNQRLERSKSPGRILEEMRALYEEYGIRHVFGTDDNFFNNHDRTLAIAETLANGKLSDGRPFRKGIRWATEATVHDTLQLKDHLKLIRTGGLRGLWLGVEDMTATVVKKGQSVDKTTEAFQLLTRIGIQPNPMMMHHDGQPLWTPGKPYGLLNQAHMLRKAGACTFQVLMLSPATGSKLYEGTYNSGTVIRSANGREFADHMRDANYVVATAAEKPWRMQINMLIAYMFFYNPLRFLWAIVRPRSQLYSLDPGGQALGMLGLLQTMRRTIPWAFRLWRGPIVRASGPPISPIPMRSAEGKRAAHALNAQEDPAPEPKTVPGAVSA